MTSWRVEIARAEGETTSLDLIDAVGPINTWSAVDPNAFTPNRGDFTNQTNRVVPTAQPSWQLDNIDIDTVHVNDTGPGTVMDSGGTFPNGDIIWKILQEL